MFYVRINKMKVFDNREGPSSHCEGIVRKQSGRTLQNYAEFSINRPFGSLNFNGSDSHSL
jgi:hypothetical protein